MLEEYASITGTIDIDRTPLDHASLLADDLLNTDLLILSGAFDSNGERVRNADNNAWDTDVLLVDLVAAGNDVIDGGDGKDVILGQRGDDSISGGRGADLVIGDNATSLLQFDSTLPHIVHGLRVLETASDVPIEVEFGGSVIVPEIAVTPQDLSLTKPLSDVVTGASPELQAVALNDSLARTDGTNLVPYISIIPDVGRHEGVLAGNDTIDGGSGDDNIYGDNLRAFSEPQSIQARVDVAAGNVTKRLEDVDEALARLVQDFDLVEAGLLDAPAHDVSIANDSITGGDGNDTIAGDDGTIVGPASTRSAIDTDNYQADAVARLDHQLNLKHLLLDFEAVLEEADVELVQELVDSALVENPDRNRLETEDVVVLQHEYHLQNDFIDGGEGDDTIIGDHSLLVLPTASTNGTLSEQFDPQDVSAEVTNDTNAALRDLENIRRIEQRDHIKDDHEVSDIPPRRDRRLIPQKSEHHYLMGNDVLHGDAGEDLIIGDRGETVIPVLQELPDRNADANSLQSGINAVFSNGDFRDLLDTEAPEGYTEYRYFPARIHKSERDPSVSLDTIDAGADDDVVFGDNAEVQPLFVRDTPLDELQFVATPLDIRDGGGDDISGGDGNDIVFAQSGDDLIHGNDGDDTLYGDRGQDVIYGDAGEDELRGGSHRDEITEDLDDSRASQGGGNGSDELDVTIEYPWGELISNLNLDNDNIDPHTDLWETFVRATD